MGFLFAGTPFPPVLIPYDVAILVGVPSLHDIEFFGFVIVFESSIRTSVPLDQFLESRLIFYSFELCGHFFKIFYIDRETHVFVSLIIFHDLFLS